MGVLPRGCRPEALVCIGGSMGHGVVGQVTGVVDDDDDDDDVLGVDVEIVRALSVGHLFPHLLLCMGGRTVCTTALL